MKIEKRKIKRILLILLLLAVLSGLAILTVLLVSDNTGKKKEDTGYSAHAEKAIDDFVKTYGKGGELYKDNSYVVSDFDNTTSIFDITYQCFIYQLETMSFGMSPEEMRTALGTEIDPDADDNGKWIDDIISAYTVLYEDYGPFDAKGLDEKTQEKLHKDLEWKEFSTKMRAFMDHVEETNSIEIGYLWELYWFTGLTHDEIYDLFYRSCSKYQKESSFYVKWTSPEEITSQVGVVSTEFTKGVSVPDDVKGMLKKIHDGGIDIWICSASHMDGVRAAVDAFGLSDYITGVIGMTTKLEDGKHVNSYDFENGHAWRNQGNGKWEETDIATRAFPEREGKVEAIENALIPMYSSGPLAGFMDSSGDFNFCTEFESMKMVICYNRANRKITEGAGLIAIVATYQKEDLKYDLKKANDAGDTLYILQGRDENGMRSLRPSDETIRLDENKPKRFLNEDNDALLKHIEDNGFTTGEILNKFSISTEADAPDNTFKRDYGHLTEYRGYHSIMVD